MVSAYVITNQPPRSSQYPVA